MEKPIVRNYPAGLQKKLNLFLINSNLDKKSKLEIINFIKTSFLSGRMCGRSDILQKTKLNNKKRKK